VTLDEPPSPSMQRSSSSLGGSLWFRARFKNIGTRCWFRYALKAHFGLVWIVARSSVTLTHFIFTFVARQ
jgi:hypothetical protein